MGPPIGSRTAKLLVLLTPLGPPSFSNQKNYGRAAETGLEVGVQTNQSLIFHRKTREKWRPSRSSPLPFFFRSFVSLKVPSYGLGYQPM